jgi:peptidoglycan/LPS O-acetylase OafA/YrhL
MGVGFVGVCLWLFDDRFAASTGAAAWGTVVGFPLLSVGLGLLVASALSHNGALAQVKVPGARMVALLAYSLYLTHKEVMHLVDQVFPSLGEARPWTLLLVYVASSFAVAGVLYGAVERPLLSLRDVHERRAKLRTEMLREPAL